MWSGCRCCGGEEEDGAIYGYPRLFSADNEHPTNVGKEVGSEPSTVSHARSVNSRNLRAAQASLYGNTPIHTGMFGETLPVTQEVLQITVSLQQAILALARHTPEMVEHGGASPLTFCGEQHYERFRIQQLNCVTGETEDRDPLLIGQTPS
ncbi:hypothetical protein WAI453_010308 [Rhynchosporium graminicola]